MSTVWVIRNDTLREELFDDSFISIGWDEVGDLRAIGPDQSALAKRLSVTHPDSKSGAYPVWAGMLIRFAFAMEPGDLVIYPVKATGTLNFGRVTGDYRYEADAPVHKHRRDVEWTNRDIPRTSFNQETLNGIGVPLTLFKVAQGAENFGLQLDPASPTTQPPSSPSVSGEEPARDAINVERVAEHTADFVTRVILKELSHQEFEEFTADVLRALGYQARVTPFSGDGGIDVIAHRDALGLEPPLIKVQCKHTDATQSRPDVQRLLGALSATGEEVGLYVTLGQFSKDAIALERERHNLRLLNGTDLVSLTLQIYDSLPTRWRDRMPLRPLLVVDRPVEAQ